MIAAMFLIFLFVLGNAAVAEDHLRPKPPVIYDAMMFENKPDLGLSQDVGFVYEWEATLRDEARELAARDIRRKPSSRTIESEALSTAISSRLGRHKYVVIDIESLKPEDDPIAIKYVQIAKASAPGLKVAWWNTGPNVVENTWRHPFDRSSWLASWHQRNDLERANDFLILGSYFSKTQTLESWAEREIPRVLEARRQFPEKMLLVTIAPHPFDAGVPWQHVSADFFGGAMDRLAQAGVNGIVIWSVENSGRGQKWDESWQWVGALRKRIGSDGRYRAP